MTSTGIKYCFLMVNAIVEKIFSVKQKIVRKSATLFISLDVFSNFKNFHQKENVNNFFHLQNSFIFKIKDFKIVKKYFEIKDFS